MRIIHTADLHLDSKMESNMSPDKARQRKNELIDTFKRMVRYADENDIRTILISGDLFDRKVVSKTAVNLVVSTIRDYPDITFFYLRGNHDDFSFVSSLDEVPENIVTFDSEWKSVPLVSNENIVITGTEISESVSDIFYDTLVLDDDRFNIVMLHGQESQSVSKDRTAVIPLNRLSGKNIDYLALGHVHFFKCDEIDKRGYYCYPGCLEGRGFDETGEHGFVVIDIDEDNFQYEVTFIPFALRTIYSEKVDVSGVSSTAEAASIIEEWCDQAQIGTDSLLEIILTGQVGIDTELDTDYICSHFEDRYFALKVKDKTDIYVDYQSFAYDRSLKGEFVRVVNDDETLTEEEKAIIIKTGVDLLSGNRT